MTTPSEEPAPQPIGDDVPPPSSIPRRRWVRLGLAFLALGMSAWFAAPRADPESWWLHGLWCIAGLVILTPTLLLPFRTDFEVTLTEHRLAFLAAFAVFLLFGAVILAVGPADTVERVLGYYPIDASQALRVDAINGLGLGIALLVSANTRGAWLGAQTTLVAEQMGRLPVKRIILFALVFGLFATAYRIYFTWTYQPGVLSGAWTIGGQLLLVAILLSAAYRGQGERALRWFAIIVAVVLALVGAMQFMKQAILEPLLALTAGLALRFGSWRVLPIGLTLLVTLFVMLGDVVGQGRAAGGFYIERITAGERWQFMLEGWTRSRDLLDEERYSSWSRLCQVTTEAAAMDFQDAGQGGNGEPAIYWVFVPRFLAPQKPAFLIGSQLHEKISGLTDSSDAVGIFVSGYYYAGWWGFIMASVLSGWIVAQTSAIARAIQRAEARVMLPFSLLGLLISLGTGGDFVSGFLAPFMYILYPLLAAVLAIKVLGLARQPKEAV